MSILVDFEQRKGGKEGEQDERESRTRGREGGWKKRR